ncbi:MAG: TIGR04282 family arsenosugar biosynthesis glycosyltransferase [Desulfocapsa sp.]|nr:TIGR04282 family arsenosugar biosynthesis glycosyltransferase [Desulfocapsa sp.]
MPSFQDLVIYFTRFPSPGKCKTRLIPRLGPEGAMRIHKQLVAHTLKTLIDFFIRDNNTEFIIYHDGGSRQEMEKWLGGDYQYKEQQGKDLGRRMADALAHGLNKTQNCILLGSDCPDINGSILAESLQALKQRDVVLGPAHDGGYYLIGVRGTVTPYICRKLFGEIPWGGDRVFAKTVEQAERLGLDFHILEKLHDIDDAEDLQYFHHCSYAE